MAASAVTSDGFIIEKASDSFLVTEPVGSFQGVEYSIIYGSATICNSTTGTYSSLRPKTSLLSSGDDTYSICVRVTDAQAINYVYGTPITFILDETLPTRDYGFILDSSLTSDGYLNIEETDSATNMVSEAVSSEKWPT